MKACKAQKEGWFDAEIVPIKATYKDRKTGKMVTTTVTKDGGCRPSTTMKGLARLRTPFKKRGGTTTAGNAS